MLTIPNMTSVLKPQKTLFIGLGGSGISTVALIKKYLDNFVDLKQTDYFQFLLIDCENPKDVFDRVDPNLWNEFDALKIGTEIKDELIGSEFLKDRLEYHFFNFNATAHKVVNTARGAGTTRIYSTISLYKHAEEIYNKISSHFNSLISANSIVVKNNFRFNIDASNLPQIFIFSSIVGGTGAGTFLDISAIARKVSKDKSIPANIWGFFYLPDVFLNNLNEPFVSKFDKTKENLIKANGYASIKELEHFLTGNPFNAIYSNNLKVDISNQPGTDVLFDKVMLINRLNSDDSISTKNAWETFRKVAESVLHFSISSIASDIPARMIDNRMSAIMKPNIILTDLIDNGRRRELFSSIGIHTLHIPLELIKKWTKLNIVRNFIESISRATKSKDYDKLYQKLRTNSLNDRDDLLGKLGILYNQRARRNSIRRDEVFQERFFNVIFNNIEKKVVPNFQVEDYRDFSKIHELEDWDVNEQLYKKTINTIESTVNDFVNSFKNDFDYDFEHPTDKYTKKYYGDQNNFSLKELIKYIIDSREMREYIGIYDLYSLFQMITNEINNMAEKFRKYQENTSERIRDIKPYIRMLLNKIEATSNFSKVLALNFDLGSIDDILERIDLGRGKYDNDIMSILNKIRDNLRLELRETLVKNFSDLFSYIRNRLNEELNDNNSYLNTVITRTNSLLNVLENEIKKIENKIILEFDHISPIAFTYELILQELDEQLKNGQLYISNEDFISLMEKRGLNFSEFIMNYNDTDKIIELFDELINSRYEAFQKSISFENPNLFSEQTIINLLRNLSQDSKPMLQFDSTLLDLANYKYCISNVDSSEWDYPEFVKNSNTRGNFKNKITFFQVVDGVTAQSINRIDEWHDIYTDLMRDRTFEEIETGSPDVYPLHIFRNGSEFNEPYIYDLVLNILINNNDSEKNKAFLENLSKEIFQDAVNKKVIVKNLNDGSYSYYGVHNFSATDKNEFVQAMAKNISLLWDIWEACNDKEKLARTPRTKIIEKNRELVESLKEIKDLKRKISSLKDEIQNEELLEIIKKIEAIDEK